MLSCQRLSNKIKYLAKNHLTFFLLDNCGPVWYCKNYSGSKHTLRELKMEQTLKELIASLEKEMIRVGYKEPTLCYYRGIWKRLISYFDSHGEVYFTEALAMQYVDEKCNFFMKEKEGLLTQSNIYLFRIVRMLGDFKHHGSILRRSQRSLSKINNTANLDILSKYKNYCIDNKYALSTQKSYYRTVENFIYYLESHNLLIENINSIIIDNYLKTLIGYSYKMVEFLLCGIRNFLDFLYSSNYLLNNIASLLPKLQSRKLTRIPSVWNKEDLLKLFSAIDRNNPSGKRDYAMILLVARLGLRCIDLKRLAFSNINWNDNYIEISQSKTGKLIRLPLLKDVGWAIIDYIKNGRPKSDSTFVFLRHMAPFEPFTDANHLHQMIVKHMRIAKLPISSKKKVGMHSLRHTLATVLLEQHLPIQEIADILGHQSTESTPVYLKSSLEQLRECALSPEVE
jgi:site-specific recombinase XerD